MSADGFKLWPKTLTASEDPRANTAAQAQCNNSQPREQTVGEFLTGQATYFQDRANTIGRAYGDMPVVLLGMPVSTVRNLIKFL